MKKLILFIFCFIPTFVFAQSMPLTEFFSVNNSTTQPYHFTINSNSTKGVEFEIDYLRDASTENEATIPGSYLMISIVSTKKISVKRTNAFGVYCGTSCMSNDLYLQYLSEDTTGYNYVLYFNIVKWKITLGNSSYMTYFVGDNYTFTNLQSGTADVYLYGAYANDVNEMKGLINDVNTTNNIIENNNQNTQDIIDNNDNNTNTIIDNDNANTQAIIDSNMSCQQIDKSNILIDNSFINYQSGNIGTDSNYGVTDYISIDSKSKLIINQNYHVTSIGFCFYAVDKTKISCHQISSYTNGSEITIPSNAKYFRSTINKANNKPNFSLCKNYNLVVDDSINGLNDNITNSGIDEPNSDFSDMEDMIAENGVITNLLSLPITLYSKILNSVNGSCSNYNLGTLFGTSITFSCISLQSLLGNTIWGVIDILFSGFTIYSIAKKMIKVFNNMSSLKEGDVIDD